MQQLPTTDAERSIGFLAAAQAARQEGRLEGRLEGRNEGQHQALLAVALDLFGPDGVAGLDAIADPDKLRAEIRRRAQVKLAR
jgi:predicted transposase YdaD